MRNFTVLILTILVCQGMLSAQPFTLANSIAGVDHYFGNTDLMGGGSTFFDYNNDGHLDIYMAGGTNQDALWENQGDGTFIDVSTAAGLSSTTGFHSFGAIAGDLENDGDRDLFIFTQKGFNNYLYINNGDGTFTDITAAAGFSADVSWSTSASFGDYNLDGYLDLYVGNYVETSAFLYDSLGMAYGFAHDCSPNWLYLNNGDMTFTEISSIVGGDDDGCVLATAWSDYDRDGDPDMLIANDFGEWVVPNVLYKNRYPADFFVRHTDRWSGMYGMGIAVGDFDHDLDLDYYMTNIARNRLYLNNGTGNFNEGTAAAGIEDIYIDTTYTVGWGAVFADLDLDGWQDLLVSNGHIPALEFIANDVNNNNRVFHNNGDGTFTDIAPTYGVDNTGFARGLACGDYDDDGDVDFIFNNIESFYTSGSDPVLLYRNDQVSGNHYLKVQCQGVANNRDGIGAQLEIEVGGDSWLTEIGGGSSHASQNANVAHFGLGSNLMVDAIRVYWPGGGMQEVTGIAADQTILIVEDTTAMRTAEQLPGLQLFPNPVVNDAQVKFDLTQDSDITVRIFDATGRSVALVYQGNLPAGEHRLRWDGADAGGDRLPMGQYILELVRNGESESIPILVAH
jgi:hypothetical protein